MSSFQKHYAFTFCQKQGKSSAFLCNSVLIFLLLFVSSVQAKSIGVDRSCGFCEWFTRRKVVINNLYPFSVNIRCYTDDHSLKPQLLAPYQQYNFTFHTNILWETEYRCALSWGKFLAFSDLYDCNELEASYICQWRIHDTHVDLYSWKKDDWIPHNFE